MTKNDSQRQWHCQSNRCHSSLTFRKPMLTHLKQNIHKFLNSLPPPELTKFILNKVSKAKIPKKNSPTVNCWILLKSWIKIPTCYKHICFSWQKFCPWFEGVSLLWELRLPSDFPFRSAFVQWTPTRTGHSCLKSLQLMAKCSHLEWARPKMSKWCPDKFLIWKQNKKSKILS